MRKTCGGCAYSKAIYGQMTAIYCEKRGISCGVHDEACEQYKLWLTEDMERETERTRKLNKTVSEYDRGYAEGMKDGINEMKNNPEAQYEIGYTQGQIDAIGHGEWIKKESETTYWYECSECGEEPLRDGYGQRAFSRYCPNCGAHMDKGET